MLHYSSLLSADLLGKLEDRLQDNVDDIPVNDLVEVGRFVKRVVPRDHKG